MAKKIKKQDIYPDSIELAEIIKDGSLNIIMAPIHRYLSDLKKAGLIKNTLVERERFYSNEKDESTIKITFDF